jgi:hypothetical protein
MQPLSQCFDKCFTLPQILKYVPEIKMIPDLALLMSCGLREIAEMYKK